ncbi:SIMPL domain-containing protein [Pontibacter litorisediminis]|uniref:SIMPL domain-containing protein n=1 Tax=Pontibacter litorisediminis TaxID=1846260 RepID=UPI0023EC8375|nr:SIMPL domain-containing protein [Pontibacter litorisediminis]
MVRKLQITGKGKLSVAPDIVILSFDATAQQWEYEKTVNALNGKVEELRRIIENMGLERKSLKTKDFSVRKDTSWNKETGKHDFNGFSASHHLELELPLDKAIINRLLIQIAHSLDNLDFSIAFGVRDASVQQQQLILGAIAKAKENAALIANATGVTLMEIIDIDYSYRELTIRSQRHNYQLYETNMASTYDASPDFEPDDIEVTETVTITWRID